MQAISANQPKCSVDADILITHNAATRYCQIQGNGQSYMYVAGVHHTFWNAGDGTDLEIILTERPSGESELFFRNFCGMGHDAGSLSKLNPLRAIMLFVYTDIRLSAVPLPVWNVIKQAVAPSLRFLRLAHPIYVEYSG